MPSAASAVISLLSALLCLTEADDRVLRLSGKTFSLELVEPAGWQLATRAAPQIANFILHPEGQDWRRAEAVIYVRIVPREQGETSEDFVESSAERFSDLCPFADRDDRTDLLQEVPGFQVEQFRCPGVRDEVVAVTEAPDALVVFTLSSKPGGLIDQFGMVLRKILISFSWHEKGSDDLSRKD